MRQTLTTLFPSMFHRRLLMLAAVALVAGGLLGAQTLRLTTGSSHREKLEAIEGMLIRSSYVPTVRGRILDRHGRPLAVDAAGYDIAVDFSVLSGKWAYDSAFDAAFDANRERWMLLSESERDALVAAHQRRYDEQVETLYDDLCTITGIERRVLDRRVARVRQKVQAMASHLWERWRQAKIRELEEEVPLGDVADDIAQERQAHVILSNVTPAAMDEVRLSVSLSGYEEGREVWSHVQIRRPRRRLYPNETMTIRLPREHLPGPLRAEEPVEIEVEGVGMHILGQLRPAYREDILEDPFYGRDEDGERLINLHGLMDGDEVGQFGVERWLDQHLRGYRGHDRLHLDTGDIERRPTRRGQDGQLTIDIRLQARVQAIMDPAFGLLRVQPWHAEVESEDALARRVVGEPLHGATVVLDVSTGEVLAAVSTPSMPLAALVDRPRSLYGDHINRPTMNRTVTGYRPGSTMKPLSYAVGVAERAVSVDERYNDIGFYDLNNDGQWQQGEPRDWLYKTYLQSRGEIGPVEAIKFSNNPYFCHIGAMVGWKSLTRWYERFGLGRPTGVGLIEERGGQLPNTSLSDRTYGLHDAALLGMGQGRVDWTPMQAANAYAALARGGQWLTPTLVKDEHRPSARESLRLPLDPQSIDHIFQGMHAVVNDRQGTGHYWRGPEGNEALFNVVGLEVVGKSGTAQTEPLRLPIDEDGDGYPDRWTDPVLGGTHSWFVAVVRPEGAAAWTHVVVTIVEYGGSGSQVAGPVVNQMLHALQDEGYLP